MDGSTSLAQTILWPARKILGPIMSVETGSAPIMSTLVDTFSSNGFALGAGLIVSVLTSLLIRDFSRKSMNLRRVFGTLGALMILSGLGVFIPWNKKRLEKKIQKG